MRKNPKFSKFKKNENRETGIELRLEFSFELLILSS